MKNNNGITLIALVVTIIVLLILAGVSITMVAGDNGIATKARKSAEATEIGTIKEDIKLEVSEKYTENLGILTEDEFVTILESYGTLSDEENVLDKTLTTNPAKTDTSKSYEIKVSDLYNGSFGDDNSEEEDDETTATYTVTFYAEDKTTVLQTVTVEEGKAATYTGTTPTKSGYTFQYWVADGETIEYELDNITSSVNLYPYFTSSDVSGHSGNTPVVPTTTYTVTFYAEDKTTVLQEVTVNSGDAVSFTGTEPTKTDYTFAYWVADGETTEYELDSITEDVNLYPYFVTDSGTSCFIAGTKVLTENGLMDIEDVEVGMKVYSFDLEIGKVELKQVTQKHVNDVTDDLGKVYVNGNIIESTVEHPYYVIGKGWTKVKDLNIGDKVQTVDGEELVIEDVEIIENTSVTTVYNIKVEDNHNYYVGDYCVLVHNKGHGSPTPM